MVLLEGGVHGNLTNNCCGMLGLSSEHMRIDLDGSNSTAFVDETAKADKYHRFVTV